MAIEGFLHTKGKKIVNGRGEEILLTGWGLGNWLLQEGYMWKAYGERFDRPSRIEKAVEELTGRDFAEYFWKEYRCLLYTSMGPVWIFLYPLKKQGGRQLIYKGGKKL